MEEKNSDTIHCSNCGTVLQEGFKYCPNCGQEHKEKENVKLLFSQFLSDYFTFDSKIGRSVIPLVVKPGFLTLEYLKGKRIHYIPPLRMFIFLSIIFFILLGFSSSNVEIVEGVEQSISDNFWDQYFESRLPKLFFILLPVFASILRLLFNRKKYGWLHHFLFALHFHSTIFILGILYFLLSKLLLQFDFVQLNFYLLLLFVVYLFYYLAISIKKVYQQTWLKVIWKMIVLNLLYVIALVLSSLGLLAVLLANG